MSKHYNVNSIIWTDDMVSELGTMNDSDFAIKHDISVSSTCTKRVKLNIPPYIKNNKHLWTEYMISLLGTMSDAKLAKKFNISRRSIQMKRKELGINSFKTANNTIEWTDDIISLLGKITDKEIAKIANCCTTTVYRKRIMLGIAACSYTNSVHDWTVFELSLLGADTDKKISAILGLSVSTVNLKRNSMNIKAYTANSYTLIKNKLIDYALLHKNESYSEIAKALDMSVFTVALYLNSAGIYRYSNIVNLMKQNDLMSDMLNGVSYDELSARYSLNKRQLTYIKTKYVNKGVNHEIRA